MNVCTQRNARLILAIIIAALILLFTATAKDAQASGYDCYHHTTTDWVSSSRAVVAVYYPRYSSWSWSPRAKPHWQHKHWYFVYVFDHHKVIFKGWQQVNCSH